MNAERDDADGDADDGDGDGDGYVHDPSSFDGGGGGERAPFESADVPTADADGLGRRGWVLLATVVLAFFGAPAVIYLRPPGVPFEVALLVVPLFPAFALGAVAVWALAGRAGK